MIKRITTLVCFLFFLSTPFGFAEYYQYVDKNGTKHFTDNILDVPEDQRKQLNIHQSIESPDEEPVEAPQNLITQETLDAKKNELSNQYNALIKKQADLDEQKKNLGKKKFDEQVSLLNDEIRQFQEETKAYEQLIIQYNTQITSTQKEDVSNGALKNNSPEE